MPAIQHVLVLTLRTRSSDSACGRSNPTGTTPTREATTANRLPSTAIVNFGRTTPSYQLGKGIPTVPHSGIRYPASADEIESKFSREGSSRSKEPISPLRARHWS